MTPPKPHSNGPKAASLPLFRSVLSALLTVIPQLLPAGGPENVLLVVNRSSPISRRIGEYYLAKRKIPLANLCHIAIEPKETIARAEYDRHIAGPIAAFLREKNLRDRVLYIVTTSGVPLQILPAPPNVSDRAAVDSELTLLYADLRGAPHRIGGAVPNPYYGRRHDAFTHPRFPMYLVTRLDGYNFQDVREMIDRSLAARNRGKFVIDLKSSDDQPGNNWLRTAAMLLPKERVIWDESTTVIRRAQDVIGYAAWGSNDPHRKERFLDFRWLPGAIVTEFVSSNARTFQKPPDNWTFGTFKDPSTWFAGSPQSLAADYIREGATGASGHVFEPYLHFTPRPDYLLPAHYQGRNLAESYYLAIPALSWMNVVVGDPLCTLGRPE